MASIRISGSVARPFRPGLTTLEDRVVPATLISTAGIAGLFDGANAPVEVIAVSNSGQQILAQSTATNLIPGQIDVPDTMDLFYFNRATGTRSLVTAFDPPAGSGLTPFVRAVGVEPSIPGVLHNAVLSADGSAVGFLSGANANVFDSKLPITADDGGLDMFVWYAADKSVELASRSSANATLGSRSLVTNPAISSDGKAASFVSTTSAWQSIDNKYIIARVTGPGDIAHGFGGRNLFRTVVGETPVPVSVQLVRTGKFAGDIYYFYDNVEVDPLGRYTSDNLVTFTATFRQRDLVDAGGDEGARGGYLAPADPTLGRDVDRFSFVGVGFGAVNPNIDRLSSTFEGFQLGATRLGDVVNAILPRDRSDFVYFTATVQDIESVDFFGNPIFLSGNLVEGYENQNGGQADLYRATFFGGQRSETELISREVGSTNRGANGVLDGTPVAVQVTPDSRRVTFTSTATNLVENITDRNKTFDIFQLDSQSGKMAAISVTGPNPNRTGAGASRFPAMISDGLVVAFQSDANDLSTIPDGNGGLDVYVRNIPRGTTTPASVQPGNFRTGDGPSFNPVIGGTFLSAQLFYVSTSTDIATRAKLDGVNQQIFSVQTPLISNNASRFVAFSGGPNGFATIGQTDFEGNIIPGTKFQPFLGFRGELRIASGDVTGDGVPDLVVGAGPGGGPRVQVIDGFTGRIIDDFFAFESTFTGGVYVALGEFNADGRQDLIVGAGELGGPRVQIYDSASRRLILDQFAFEPQSRVGVRVAAGDVTGDGLDDLIVGAGFGGGPRVRVFNGSKLPTLSIAQDFFAFEPTQRSGVFVSAGDFDNDGLADLIVGTGPGVETRVRIYNAANLTIRNPNIPITFRDFLPFGAGDTTGARPALRNIIGDINSDILVATASGLPVIRSYTGNNFGPTGTSPLEINAFIPFNAVDGQLGAFVG